MLPAPVAAAGLPHIYLTNGGGVLESVKAQQLSELFALPVAPEQVVLSHSPLRPLAARHGEDLVLVVGMRDCAAVARAYGFSRVITPADVHAQFGSLLSPHTSLDPLHYPTARASDGRRADGSDAVAEARALLGEVKAVLVLHDPRDWYVDLQVCLDVLLAGRPERVAERAAERECGRGKDKGKCTGGEGASHTYSKLCTTNLASSAAPEAGAEIASTGGASGFGLPQDPAHEPAGAQRASAPYCGAPHLGPSQLYTVAQALRGGYAPRHTPFYLSNPDLLYSARFDVPRLAQGAFTEVLGYLYARVTGEPLHPVVCGKPTAATYAHADALLDAQAAAHGAAVARCYGVGDNPAADIEGANRAGPRWDSVFVRTGSIPRSSLPLQQPKHDFADVRVAVDALLKAHGIA